MRGRHRPRDALSSSRPPRSCSAGARTSSVPSPTRTCARSASGSGLAAGAQRAGRRVRAARWPRRSASTCPTGRSSPGRTTSIPTCRRTTRSASTTSRSRRRLARDRRRRVGIERAHLEEDTGKTVARRWRRSHPRRRLLARRLQPRRRPADGDRDATRHPLARSRRVRTSRSCAPSLLAVGVSDVKMEEGSMRVDANVSVRPRRDVRARHQGRDQEHELAALARARDRVRDRATDRRCSRPASASCRRRATGTRPTAGRTACGPRKRSTTTGTSPSPTSCRSRRRGEMRDRVRVDDARAARPRSAPGSSRSGGSADDDARVLVDVPGLAEYAERAVAGVGAPAVAAEGRRQLVHRGGARRT